MGLFGEAVAGGGRALGLLLERTGPGGSAEYPVLCRPQLAAVGFLAGGVGRRVDGFGYGRTVFAGRLLVMKGKFLGKGFSVIMTL